MEKRMKKANSDIIDQPYDSQNETKRKNLNRIRQI